MWGQKQQGYQGQGYQGQGQGYMGQGQGYMGQGQGQFGMHGQGQDQGYGQGYGQGYSGQGMMGQGYPGQGQFGGYQGGQGQGYGYQGLGARQVTPIQFTSGCRKCGGTGVRSILGMQRPCKACYKRQGVCPKCYGGGINKNGQPCTNCQGGRWQNRNPNRRASSSSSSSSG